MADDGYYYVKGWWQHQHYRDRHPPWIKLHRTILTDPVIQSLTEVERWRLIKLWIVAADMDGRCPIDSQYMARTWELHRYVCAAHLLAKFVAKGLISKEDIRGERPPSASTRHIKKRQKAEADPSAFKEQKQKEHAPARTAPSPPLAFDGQKLKITTVQDAALGEAFPWTERKAEYAKADSWLVANPSKRVKKFGAFAHNWFSRISKPNTPAPPANAEPEFETWRCAECGHEQQSRKGYLCVCTKCKAPN